MKDEIIEHWIEIISAVFRAEDEIRGEWEARLREAKNLSKEGRNKIATDYLRAIATKIVSCTYDREGEADSDTGRDMGSDERREWET